jgi:hypothetical protein
MMIGEGWAKVMYQLSDVTGLDRQPRPNASQMNLIGVYVLMFLCNSLLMNLFAGLIINNYRRIKEELENFRSLNEVS